jgi:hypothetical protein
MLGLVLLATIQMYFWARVSVAASLLLVAPLLGADLGRRIRKRGTAAAFFLPSVIASSRRPMRHAVAWGACSTRVALRTRSE